MKKSLRKLGLICLSIPAAAQAVSAPRENTMIEEVMVTAEKRSQSIQDIPASISAFDERAVRDAGIVDVSLVAPRVPGFYAGGFGTSRPQLYIRGIGTRQFDPGSESSVGVFVDEAYLGRTGGVLGTLKDVQRIEVLKGPQGTLYGRNVIGGVVNVVTKGPSDEFEAEAEIGAGNYSSKNLFGAVSGPLIEDKLSGRAALWHSYREGYMTNLTTGEHPQGLDNSGGRFRLLFTPADNLRMDLIADFARDTGDSFQGESIGSTANPDGILLGGGGTPKKSGDKFKQFYTTDTDYSRDVDALNAKIEYDLESGTLISVSTYREMSYSDDRDFDNTSLDVMRQISVEDSEQLTQEIRFVSSPDGPLSFNGKVDWIAGIYYFSDESSHFDTFKYGPDSAVYAPTADGSYPTDVTGGLFDTTSNAYFGQATILLTDQLDLTLGLRYTKDTKEAVLSGTTTDARPLVSADFTVVNPSQDFTSTDPKAVLNYRVNDDLSFYTSYSQGFKSGGYQYTSLNASQAGIVFEPEQLVAYEIGFKSQWLDNSLTFNGAVYQFDYTDIQVSRVVQLSDGSTPSLIDNAGESEIRGLEMDLLYRPTVALTLNFAYAYTDAKYLDYVASNAVDYSDTRMVRAPENSFNIGAEYIIPLKDEMELILRGDYSYNSEFFHEPGEADAKYGTTAPYTKEDAYGLANVRATVNIDTNWRASVWANNVLDEEYRSTILALPGQVINIYGLPRTFGATVAWTY